MLGSSEEQGGGGWEGEGGKDDEGVVEERMKQRVIGVKRAGLLCSESESRSLS